VNQSKIMVLADWSQWESHPGWVPKGESSPKKANLRVFFWYRIHTRWYFSHYL